MVAISDLGLSIVHVIDWFSNILSTHNRSPNGVVQYLQQPFPQIAGVAFFYVANAWIVSDTDKIQRFTRTYGLTAEVISACR